MNRIIVDVPERCQSIYVNERFNEKLHAYLVSEDGAKQELFISQSGNGLQVDLNGSYGKVLITYKNGIYSFGIYCVPLYFLMGIILLVKAISKQFGYNTVDYLDGNS